MEQDKILSAVEALRSDDHLMWLVSGWTMPKLRELGALEADRITEMLADARDHYGDCVKSLAASDCVKSLAANFPEGTTQ